jgi:hypothetical protein
MSKYLSKAKCTMMNTTTTTAAAAATPPPGSIYGWVKVTVAIKMRILPATMLRYG